MRSSTLLLLGLWLTACGSDERPGPPPQHDTDNAIDEGGGVRIGMLMMETGRRFELSGRAGAAGRWELAAYEVQEIRELFERDMIQTRLPARADHLAAVQMRSVLERERLPALQRAAEARDEAAFRAAFRATAETCNGCHAATRNPFVEVPLDPGNEVPVIDTAEP